MKFFAMARKFGSARGRAFPLLPHSPLNEAWIAFDWFGVWFAACPRRVPLAVPSVPFASRFVLGVRSRNAGQRYCWRVGPGRKPNAGSRLPARCPETAVLHQETTDAIMALLAEFESPHDSGTLVRSYQPLC